MSKIRKARPSEIAAMKYALKPHPYLLGKADLRAAYLAGVRWQKRRKEQKA